MEKEYFYVRHSRENFEYYAGHGLRKEYESPEEFTPLSQARFGGFLYFLGYILDEQGNAIGCRFKGDAIHEVYPGEIYSILSSTTAVDDDGCPEDVSIWHYIQLIPYSE